MPLLRGVARVADLEPRPRSRTASPAGRRTAGPRMTRASTASPPLWRRSLHPTRRRLKQLGELKTAGVLTGAEFEAQKAKILAGV